MPPGMMNGLKAMARHPKTKVRMMSVQKVSMCLIIRGKPCPVNEL